MTAVLMTVVVVGTVAVAVAVDVAVMIAWLRKRTAPAWRDSSGGRGLLPSSDPGPDQGQRISAPPEIASATNERRRIPAQSKLRVRRNDGA
jgi:hypothetical protein